MGEMTEGGHLNAGIDLSQFYQVFFEEAGENLENMEQLLLDLDIESADDEELNAIFRCAHSIKGGAATFGFEDVAELTHKMETLLDKLRRHELSVTTDMVDVLLAAGDMLKALLGRHQTGDGDAVDASSLVARIAALAEGAPAREPSKKRNRRKSDPSIKSDVKKAMGDRILTLTVGPLEKPEVADHLAELFNEIPGLGKIEPTDGGQADAQGMRRFRVTTTSTEEELLDLFGFHVAREQVRFEAEALAIVEGADVVEEDDDDADFGFFDNAPPPPVAATKPQHEKTASAPKAAAAGAPESTTLRVSVEKVDQLINLVGELVITQAMLAQTSRGLDPVRYQSMASGLADLERNTRSLQESVMSIRMIPMAVVFNRFPRMLRDLAQRLGKQVELQTIGEATELDKGLVEKITDPLTHLVRNSVDHGIEPPDKRIAAGKSAHGTITLAAAHQGGSILIEVRDDGRGLNREKILSKARERGLPVRDGMSDGEVWQLIFEPGFSTADEVTDVSGRGVGMDVVKRNIASLGGSVEIESREGQGMRVAVRLPLTLAIMDGMSVRVGGEIYILPLASVVESFQLGKDDIRTVHNSDRVVEVRGEYLPVSALDELFDIPRGRDARDASNAIMVVVETEGARVALLVDELVGQQQIVVKNLEANYRKVRGVSGATILGDGRVALIVDVGAVVKRTRH
ncbi:MAG TPA: chemotaxis protein CheW [Burkholderiaceae bacterium]|nr:chemotaxis protein CheW [Burkholderiaceae bacterium]